VVSEPLEKLRGGRGVAEARVVNKIGAGADI